MKPIAYNIGAGSFCFLNTDTLEMEDFPQELIFYTYEMEMRTGILLEELDLKPFEWKNYIDLTPLESPDAFEIMVAFARQLKDIALQNKVVNALSNRKLFVHFKNRIDKLFICFSQG